MEGKIMIRKGNENQAPCAVYVSHKNNFGWVSFVLNTGGFYLSKEESLIDFDYNLLQRMGLQWKIEQLPKTKERLQQQLEEMVEYDKIQPTQKEGFNLINCNTDEYTD